MSAYTTDEVDVAPRAREPGERGPALIRCEGVTKSFGAVHALRGVDFELRPGEVHALLGQNGAGKSTLIKVLAGALEWDAGTMRISGEEARFRTPADSRAAGISVVYQELSLVPSMTVAANLFLGQEPCNRLGLVRRRQTERDARAMLSRLGVAIDPGATVGKLAFAYRQMTEIAKALDGDVQILILDEPTSALSEAEAETLFGVIGEVTKRGVGVIYITHRLSEVFRISDRVTVIRDGANVGTLDTGDTDMGQLVAEIVGPEHEDLRRGEAEALGSATDGASPGRAPEEGRGSSATARGDRRPVLELREARNDRLNGVDLTVGEGEVVGLAGMVGSGRTEILETIFGLRRLASGELRLDGAAPRRLRRPADAIRHGVALVPEDRHEQALVLQHSIERNVALTCLSDLRRLGMFQRGASNARARGAIEALGVKAPGPDTPVRSLSGGNQQKVVFGKWQDPRPRLLLLDEPTVGVDVGAREELYRIIRDIAREGSAVLVVSSELAELLLLCDRIAIVADGDVVRSVDRRDIDNEEHLHRLVQEAEGAVAEDHETPGSEHAEEAQQR